MFQDINVAKSAPFVLLTIFQNPCIPPKISKVPPFWQITRNSPTILYLDHEKWKPQISQQIARNSLNSPITTAHDAKST